MKLEFLRIFTYYLTCLVTIGIFYLFTILVGGNPQNAIYLGLFLSPISIEIVNVYGHLKDI